MPEMSSTADGTSSVACQTPPAWLPLPPSSAVNSSRWAQGSQVDPSKTGNELPFTSRGDIGVQIDARDVSRLIGRRTGAGLVALEEKVSAVVVARIGAALVLQDEVR